MVRHTEPYSRRCLYGFRTVQVPQVSCLILQRNLSIQDTTIHGSNVYINQFGQVTPKSITY